MGGGGGGGNCILKFQKHEHRHSVHDESIEICVELNLLI